jgi:hypothetical protein
MFRKALTVLVAVLGLTAGLMAVTITSASAHDFNGTKSCDAAHGAEWVLQLDGTYGAHTIVIDGVEQVEVKTSYHVPDASGDTERTFTVTWDKDSDDVTQTHTLEGVSAPCLHKVDICHRTNSVTNPYTENNVDDDSVDGDDGNDNGNGDHNLHNGDVFDVTGDPDVLYPPPRNGDQWGDIIPPFYDDGETVGPWEPKNWDEAGQAIFYAGCAIPPPPPEECPDDTVGEFPDCVPECPTVPGIPATDDDCNPPQCEDPPCTPVQQCPSNPELPADDPACGADDCVLDNGQPDPACEPVTPPTPPPTPPVVCSTAVGQPACAPVTPPKFTG